MKLNYDELVKSNKFDRQQLKIILNGLNNNNICDNVYIYAKPEFNHKQMIQIKIGLKKGEDVSLYADPSVSWKAMKEIRLLISQGVDEKDINELKKYYDSNQIREIRLGIKSKIQVEYYKNPKMNFSEMQDVRKNLLENKKIS